MGLKKKIEINWKNECSGWMLMKDHATSSMFIGDGDMENSVEIEAEQPTGNQNEKSFIIVWQVNNA